MPVQLTVGYWVYVHLVGSAAVGQVIFLELPSETSPQHTLVAVRPEIVWMLEAADSMGAPAHVEVSLLGPPLPSFAAHIAEPTSPPATSGGATRRSDATTKAVEVAIFGNGGLGGDRGG